jgi:hypothetical protein
LLGAFRITPIGTDHQTFFKRDAVRRPIVGSTVGLRPALFIPQFALSVQIRAIRGFVSRN